MTRHIIAYVGVHGSQGSRSHGARNAVSSKAVGMLRISIAPFRVDVFLISGAVALFDLFLAAAQHFAAAVDLAYNS